MNEAKDAEKNIERLISQLTVVRDRIQSRGVKVSLAEVIAQGVAQNPDLSRAFADIQRQEWRLIGAQRQWYPTLNMNSDLGYRWGSTITNPYSAPRQNLSQRLRIYESSANKNVTVPSQFQINDQNAKDPYYQLDKTTPRPVRTSKKSKNFEFSPRLVASWTFLDPARQPAINSARVYANKNTSSRKVHALWFLNCKEYILNCKVVSKISIVLSGFWTQA